MKVSKRFLCTLLAVVFTLVNLAVVPAFADFTDVAKEHAAYDAVNVLNKLGVINGYDDGSFKPDNNVTRAEFTAMLLRTRGMGAVGSTSLENPPFPDVTTPDVSWAIGNIRTARELKIINGYDDGTFKPNNNVSYEEAVKMIVCALGYGEMGAEGAFWYSKYLMTAKSLGFLEGAGGAVATPATRATIASMLYNCLEIKLAEDNQITEKTILENDLKLTKNVGYISSNPEISLSKPNADLRDDEVEITVNGVASTYKVDDASKYNDMLGAQIEFYSKNDFNSGLKHLILATVKNSTTVKIDADLIQSGSTSGISYLKSEDAQRETNASIASNSVVVYNGKLYGADAAASKFATYFTGEGIPLVGNMELIDRDGDNVFDVVFVNDYEPYFVSAVTSSDYKITDNALRSGSQETLNYKANNIEFVTKDGAATSFSAIKKGSVIFVAKAKGSTGDAKVIVCNDTVSGKITATSSSKGITVNGKNYKFSSLAPWENSLGGPSLAAPQMGDTAKFYLDLNGRIIWYDKTEAASNQQYGYITGAKYDNGSFEEIAQVEIITKSNVKGTRYTITTKSKLIVNGSPVAITSLQNFLEKLDKANDRVNDPARADMDYKQLVKFTTSKGTEIDEIITATATSDTPEKIAENTLNLYSLITDTTDCKYSSSRFEAVAGGKKINVSNAFILDVRTPGKYSLLTTSKLKKADAGYKIECFDVDSTNFAKVVLVYDVPVSANIGEVDEKSPVFVIDEIRHEQDGDYARYILSGWVGTTRHEDWKLSVEDTSTVKHASTLQKGDVVRLGTDSEGYYTIKHETPENEADPAKRKQHIIFSMAPDDYRSTLDNPSQKISGSTAYPEYEVIWGTLYERSNTALMVSKSILTGGEAENALNLREYEIMPSAFSGAKILVYKMENGELKIYEEVAPSVSGDETDWGYIEGLNKFTNNNGDAPAEIFMYLSNGRVKTMIIVER